MFLQARHRASLAVAKVKCSEFRLALANIVEARDGRICRFVERRSGLQYLERLAFHLVGDLAAGNSTDHRAWMRMRWRPHSRRERYFLCRHFRQFSGWLDLRVQHVLTRDLGAAQQRCSGQRYRDERVGIFHASDAISIFETMRRFGFISNLHAPSDFQHTSGRKACASISPKSITGRTR